MTPFLVILAAASLSTFAAWLTYCQRDRAATLFLLPLASALLGVCWVLLARWIDDNRAIVIASVAWDVGCVLIFALFPMLFLGHDWRSTVFWAGLGLSVAGIALMQRS